jgi:hypothetical protein
LSGWIAIGVLKTRCASWGKGFMPASSAWAAGAARRGAARGGDGDDGRAGTHVHQTTCGFWMASVAVTFSPIHLGGMPLAHQLQLVGALVEHLFVVEALAWRTRPRGSRGGVEAEDDALALGHRIDPAGGGAEPAAARIGGAASMKPARPWAAAAGRGPSARAARQA